MREIKLDISKIIIIAAIIMSIASLFIEYPMQDPMKFENVNQLGVYLSFITTVIMLLVLAIVIYYVGSLRSYLHGMHKEYITYIYLTFILSFISTIVGVIRIIDLMVLGNTGGYYSVNDHEIYWDPVAIGISLIFISAAFFFYYLYAYYYTDKSPMNKLTYTLLVIYLISFVLFIHPANNYSQQIEELTAIKILSRLMLFFTIIFPVLFVSFHILNKLKTATDAILRERIKLLLFANIMIILTIAFFILDALTREPYSIFTLFSYIANIAAVISMGIAIISPGWYISLIQKIRSR